MRFLFFCTKYPVAPGDTYMTSELAKALREEGHHVDVLHLDWQALPGEDEPKCADAHELPLGRVVRVLPQSVRGLGTTVHGASKFILSDRAARRALLRNFDVASYDVCVAWAPALAVANMLRIAKRAGVEHRILFIWDFFPIHNREIGTIPAGPIFRAAKWLEERAMATCTAVLTLLPANIAYFRRHYRVRPAPLYVGWTPIWTDIAPLDLPPRDEVRIRHGLPIDRPIAIFGGQMTQGRGIEQMLAAAAHAEAAGSSLIFLFVGEGRLTGMVEQRAAQSDSVRILPNLPRADYLALAGACDVGLVATVVGVSSFTFPSKTLDYLRAAIPIVAAVEPGNDFISILEDYRVGSGAPLGDAGRLHTLVELLIRTNGDRSVFAQKAQTCLREMFDVKRASMALMDAIDQSADEAKMRRERR